MIQKHSAVSHVCMILLLYLVLISPAAAEKVQLDYRLKWLFNMSVSGDLYADQHGYFKGAGLKVNLKEGSPEKDAITELELGHTDFGIASADQVIRALDKGAKIMVVAQLFQKNPMQWIYRSGRSRIKSLQDLKGRSIGITFGGNDEIIMNTLFEKGGISEKDVRIFGVRFDFTPFYKHEVDIWPVYRNTQGILLENRLAQAGETVDFFDPSEFGVNFVSNSVITSKKMVNNHPETVTIFIIALLQGWEASMDPLNAGKTLATVKKLAAWTSQDIGEKQLQSTRALVKPDPSIRIGTINKKAWKETEIIMLAQGQIKHPVHVDTILVNAFNSSLKLMD